jgi:hypothetical protein
MTTQRQGAPDPNGSSKENATEGVDPRDTDHPTGTERANENERDESPS